MIHPSETGQLIDENGQPVTAGNAEPPMGEHSGVKISDVKEDVVTKADKDGVYVAGKTRIKVRKGDVIPAGAKPTEERAKQAAPQNKARKPAPETKAKEAPSDKD